eukprot:6841203-Pyramimonas_sp.AAC.1
MAAAASRGVYVGPALPNALLLSAGGTPSSPKRSLKAMPTVGALRVGALGKLAQVHFVGSTPVEPPKFSHAREGAKHTKYGIRESKESARSFGWLRGPSVVDG